MPTYEYQCKNCGHIFEELQTMSEPPLVHCPHCEQDTLARNMGTGTSLIFKGSGFYGTDYKKKSASVPSPDKDAPPAKPASEKAAKPTKESKGGSSPDKSS